MPAIQKTSRIITLILIFILLDYLRPQAFIPVLGKIRPALLTQAVMLLLILNDLARLDFREIQTRVFVFLILFMAIHVPLAVNNFWAFETWLTMIQYFILYFALVRHASNVQALFKIVNFWVWVVVVCAVIGIYFGGRVPESAIMGDENDFALSLNLIIPFVYFFGAEEENRRSKLVYFLAVGLLVAANIFSGSRGGFIGLASVLFFCWLKSRRKMAALLVVGALALLALLVAPEEYWDEIKSIGEENIQEGTGAERWYSWERAMEMFLDHPIMGVGQNNYPWNVMRYEPPDRFREKSIGGRAAHSIYFTLLPELGLVGVVLFAILAAATWRQLTRLRAKLSGEERDHPAARRMTALANALQGSLVGYLVSGIFLSVLYYPHFWLLLGLSVAAVQIDLSELAPGSGSEA
jgi:probable O-glycosylation ligase (exosortase A-associated)